MENEMKKLGADFSSSVLRPRWEALDAANADVRDEVLKHAAAAGIFGFAVSEDQGGSGLGAAEYSVFLEEVSRASGGAGTLLAAHFAGLAPVLLSSNTAHALPALVAAAQDRGEALFVAPAVRENPDPDLISGIVQTMAAPAGSACVVNGVKTKVHGAGAADYFTVLAAHSGDETLCWVAVPRNARGVEIRPEAPRLGLKLCPVNDVRFKDVEVPPENVIESFSGTDRLLDYYRFTDPVYAAVALGMASQARDTALEYALQRYQGGRMICDHDVIRLLLADMDVRIRAARALAYSPGHGILGLALAAEAAEQVCLDAVQVLGGYGYMSDYKVERILRDAKTLQAMAAPRARRMEHIRVEIEKLR